LSFEYSSILFEFCALETGTFFRKKRQASNVRQISAWWAHSARRLRLIGA
jgi:hypothetical protein